MDSDKNSWYLPGNNNQPKGPYNTEEIIKALQTGQLRVDVLCWRQGMQDWQRVGEVEPFKGAEQTLSQAGSAGLNVIRMSLNKAVSMARKTADTISQKVTHAQHEKQKQRLMTSLGDLVYKHKEDIAILSQPPYSKVLALIKAEEDSIRALRCEIGGNGTVDKVINLDNQYATEDNDS